MKIDKIISNLTGFVENRIELLKIEIREEAAETGAKLLILGVFAILFLFFTIFLSFFLGEFLNKTLNSTYWGHGLVAAFYLVMIAFLALIQRPLKLKDRIKRYIETYLGNESDED